MDFDNIIENVNLTDWGEVMPSNLITDVLFMLPWKLSHNELFK